MQSERMTEKEYNRRIDMVKKCGENRGPHDYIPIAWSQSQVAKYVDVMMCRICFQRIHINTIKENFGEITIPNF